MGLPATRRTAIEENRGEDNKDPDWLIERSIALRNVEKVDKSVAILIPSEK